MIHIAVLLSGFPVQGYLKDLLYLWANSGVKVSLFRTTREKKFDTVDSQYLKHPVIELDNDDFLYKAMLYLDRNFFLFFNKSPGFSIRIIKNRFLNATKDVDVDLFVGVEKLGLIVSDFLGSKREIQHLYYSLELYIESHPSYKVFGYLREEEKKSNITAVATLIQDERRAKALCEANGLPELHKFIYLPVGTNYAFSDLIKQRDSYECSLFTVLYVGVLAKSRNVDELVGLSTRLGRDERLHIHGPFGSNEYSACDTNKLLITNHFLNDYELQNLIRKSSIGLALYNNEPINDRLTAFSSHKLALYLSMGKPVIVSRNESFQDLMSAFKCGEMIDNVNDLPYAISLIRSDYQEYSRQAMRAYKKFFDLSNTAEDVLNEIKLLLND